MNKIKTTQSVNMCTVIKFTPVKRRVGLLLIYTVNILDGN